jgi:membrane protein DedA with SNARE-associated domain
MLALVARHTFITICLAVLLEELGIPMPIPTDILIIFAGASGTGSLLSLVFWFVALSVMSALGSSGLYLAVRLGGRPLVERFGPYVHLGPAQLARAESLLARGGWFGIAAGRAIPGLRYVTVIACGLLRIRYGRYLTAHLAGSSVYIIVFLALGSTFGPVIVDQIHAPELALRLLWLLVLAVGLPLLLAWFCLRGHAQRSQEPSRRRVVGALILASFAGTTSLAAAWAGSAMLAELSGTSRPLDMTHMLASWLLGRGMQAADAYMLVYSGLLLLCVGVGVGYYEFILPRLAPLGTTLPRQALGLGLLGGSLVAAVFTTALLFQRVPPLVRWWQTGGSLLVLAITVGIFCYTLTTVYGRALGIALLPSLRRPRPRPATRRVPREPHMDSLAPDGELPMIAPGRARPHREMAEVAAPEQSVTRS